MTPLTDKFSAQPGTIESMPIKAANGNMTLSIEKFGARPGMV
jgi:hypothetical protein